MPHDSAVQHLERFAERPLCFSCRPLPETSQAINVPTPSTAYPLATDRILNHVSHALGTPITAAGKYLLRNHVGRFAEQFEALYEIHNGFSLYKDERSELTGVEILPAERWEEATYEFKQWIANMPEECDPANLRNGVAFGFIPNAADGFVISLEREYAGKIFLFRHSDAYMPAYADNFEQLVYKLTKRPVELLTEVLGDYYRCSYGGRDVWVPEEIVGEGRSA